MTSTLSSQDLPAHHGRVGPFSGNSGKSYGQLSAKYLTVRRFRSVGRGNKLQ